ncbi:hypothetical protein GCM10017083_14190 [Thalassobaculum fulvum]|uniref:DUF3306 domain-containing protein n=1 Tax=Thalassobaculum fulvum TaxID=1633335 RepID=A0A918XQZ6_9PROT|nr:DUF3306 domain-containing protein [Thalassobaculum fulvum]GHD45762.1 hypothetical protein GCM10017083_14190 [Thalassobaculum fulvum]
MSRPTEGGFLSRWSRRKQQARGGRPELPDEPRPTPVPAAATTAGGAGPDAVDEESLSDEELLARYELPDPTTLTASDDVAAFMRSGVPKRLRNMALRRVWRLDPVLANLDGLNDYDEDYTDAAMLVGAAVKTVYQVGKGGAAHLQEAAERLAADEPVGAGPGSAGPESAGPESPEDPAEAGGADGTARPGEAEPAGAESGPAGPVAGGASREAAASDGSRSSAQRRRRMVFATPEAGEIPAGARDSDN